MAEYLPKAYGFDIETREGPPENLPATGVQIDAQEVEQGPVYVQGSLRVSALVVDHGNAQPAFAYRVDYSGHSVVISGDTKFSQNLIDHSKGLDCLIHVAWKPESKSTAPVALRSIATAEDAGRVFALAKPKLAVVYHYVEEQGLADAVRSQYHGPFVVGKDLMVIEIGSETTWHEGPAGRESCHR